jgi:uncharacterized membrane protein
MRSFATTSDNENEIIGPSFQRNHGVHPLLLKAWDTIRTSITKQNPRAFTLLAATLIMASTIFTPQEALAARSGGRMGGSFGGSARSSRSYSSPSRSSGGYSRGYGGGGGGYNSYRSSPIIVAPGVGGYGYGGYGYGASGMTVVNRGPSVFDVIIFGFFASAVLSTFTRNDTDSDNDAGVLGSGVTVAKISVGINVANRDDQKSILSFLDRLSQTAKTDSRVGISNLVSQVALELLRQKQSIFGAYVESEHFGSGDKAGRDFSSKAIEERSKFENESTNNYGGVDYSNKGTGSLVADGLGGQATSAVVTLIVALDGDSMKFPQINGIRDLEQALTRLATDVKVDDCLRSAEVLWTPDDGEDVLSERDVIVDYPKLRSI